MGINVLSLFDGISCGQIALERAGIEVNQYFASEIDQQAIKVTQQNYPDTFQLGSVFDVSASNLPKIDLLIGGSPCQGFSFAGKGLNFDDPRSKLFFEFVRLLEELTVSHFLLENVKMREDSKKVIDERLCVGSVMINSSFFSAQDRKRLYWTSGDVLPYSDRCTHLADILDQQVDEGLYLSEDKFNRFQPTPNYDGKFDSRKSCVVGKLSKYQGDRVFDLDGKASSLSAFGGNNGGGGCNLIFDKSKLRLRRLSPIECERLQTVPEGYTASSPRSKRYCHLGNGWTVDVVSHLFRGMNF